LVTFRDNILASILEEFLGDVIKLLHDLNFVASMSEIAIQEHLIETGLDGRG
jgi:hypothetical protein